MAADPKKLQEIKDLLDQIQKNYNQLGKKNPFKGIDPNKIKDVNDTIQQLEVGLDGVESQVRRVNSSFDDLEKTLKAVVSEINPKGINATKDLEKGMKGLIKEAQKLANEEEDIGDLSKKQLKAIQERARASSKLAKDSAAALLQEMGIRTQDGKVQQKDGLKIGRMKAEDRAKARSALGILRDENNIQKDVLDKIQDRIDLEDEFNKKIGFGGQLAKGLDKALQKVGIPALGIADAIDGARKNFIKTKGESSVLKDTLKGVAGNLKGVLSSANLIQGAFTFLVSAMMSVDRLTGQLAKNIGVSYKESLKFQEQFNQVAIDSDHLQVNSKNLNESFNSLNQEFGGATNFSNQMLESFTALTKQAGFTSGTIAEISKLTGSQGTELENNVALMQGELVAMNALNGTTFSEKQMLEDISKVSKATLITLRNQPLALTRTLMTSKKLALSFAEMESISSSLLDFEGSIQSELEAELLTGKQLNLESARQLALKGDIAGAAAEVAKEVGSAADFEKMNVIQQEALAKAAGLTREQLSKSLIEREALQKIGMADNDAAKKKYATLRQTMSAEEAAKALGDERLGAQYESESVQERFAASVEQLKTIFVDIGTAIMPIVSFIADAVSGTAKLVKQYSGLFKVLGSIYLLFKSISIVQGVMDKFGKLNLANIKFQLGYRKALVLEYFKENVQAKLKNAYELISLQFTREGIIAKGAVLAKDLAINAATLVYNGLLGAKNILQNLFNKKKIQEGLIEMKNFAKAAANFLLSVGKLAINAAISIAKIPIIGPVLAVAAAAAAVAGGMALYSKFKKPAGDMMGTADGRTQVSPKEGGIFELSKNDDFIAAPGAADAMAKKGEKTNNDSNSGNDNSALLSGISKLISINQQILAKDLTIVMEGEKVGAGIAEAEREIQ